MNNAQQPIILISFESLHLPVTLMLNINKLIAGRGPNPVLVKRASTLGWTGIRQSRFDATDSLGRSRTRRFLPRGTVVRGGDVLLAEGWLDGACHRRAANRLAHHHCSAHGA
jgi:urease accessory protein